MGYRIEYDAIGVPRRKSHRNVGGWVAAASVIILIVGAITIKTVGLQWVQEVLLPGDPDVTAAALEGLAEDLRQGDTIGQAIKAFCQEIMEHAQIPE